MALHYNRGEVVSVPDPYSQKTDRSAVVLTDNRRPPHSDGKTRYTIVLLTGALQEFQSHDWTVKLDAQNATKQGEPPLTKDSLVEPWATYVVKHGYINSGPHTALNQSAMKKIAKAYAKMVLT